MNLPMAGRVGLFGVLATISVACQRPARLSACEEMRHESGEKADECYGKSAEEKRDPDWCAPILKAEARASCFAAVGRVLEREDVCAMAERADRIDECLAHLASAKRSAAYCEKMLNLSSRDRCFSERAAGDNEPALCAKIVVSSTRAYCLSKLANRMDTPELCGKIDKLSERDQCVASLNSSKENPEVGCERLEFYPLKETCYREAAHKDPRLCDHLGATERSRVRARCYLDALTHVRDATECTRFPDRVLADTCVAVVAAEHRDAVLCGSVKDTVERDGCWDRVADGDHPEACLNIMTPGVRRRCAQRLWRRANDSTFCSQLPPPTRQECIVLLTGKARRP